MAVLAIFGLLVVLGVAGFFYFLIHQRKKHGQYFRQRNVTFIGANFADTFKFLMGKRTLMEIETKLYQQAKETGQPYVGFSDIANPFYFVTDLELMKNIYVKDSDHFVNRRTLTTSQSDILFKKMLISLEGEQWKGIRSKLSPTFSTGKIKRMFDIFEKSSQRMCDYVRKRVGAEGGDFDICEAYSKYAMDVIATCCFGVDSKSFDCEPGVLSEFEQMGNKIQFRVTVSLIFKFILVQLAPKLADFLGFKAVNTEPQDYFMKVIKGVMKHRRETGERHNDFLQLMMDAKEGLLKNEENSKETIEVMTGSKEDTPANSFASGEESSPSKFTMDDDDIVANAVLFLIGGFDTTQSLLIFAAYMLALEQDVQERLLKEVNASLDANGGKLTYDGKPCATIHLLCGTNGCAPKIKIPGTDTVIEKGILVGLPVLGIHRDERYYENPEKFDPERFTPEKKAERHAYAFGTFGFGPRNCIGMRFAKVEVMAAISLLVHSFKLEPGQYTEIPVKMGNNSTLKPANGMWLKITPRS
ncbi:Cytochrome P450 6k1 [Orchesella cincta]|uniref:Cytochrome P450 6k1 n=1 Tax=Orchesella cincta TaxID=48709 RepID=A0A1D2MIL1_ORCCI|nr:Cytochrome P450 6k1 [Orchesella cincta]